MSMQATIIAHEKPAEAASLRTAHVIVANLGDGNAFIQMLREIVAAVSEQYDGLIGHVYRDQH